MSEVTDEDRGLAPGDAQGTGDRATSIGQPVRRGGTPPLPVETSLDPKQFESKQEYEAALDSLHDFKAAAQKPGHSISAHSDYERPGKGDDVVVGFNQYSVHDEEGFLVAEYTERTEDQIPTMNVVKEARSVGDRGIGIPPKALPKSKRRRRKTKQRTAAKDEESLRRWFEREEREFLPEPAPEISIEEYKEIEEYFEVAATLGKIFVVGLALNQEARTRALLLMADMALINLSELKTLMKEQVKSGIKKGVIDQIPIPSGVKEIGELKEEAEIQQAKIEGYIQVGSLRFDLVRTRSFAELNRRKRPNYIQEARSQLNYDNIQDVIKDGYKRRRVLDRAAKLANWKPNQYGEYWYIE